MTDIEKEKQIEKELLAASHRIEEMLTNTFSPKVLPLVMMGAQAAGRWTPRPLALWIARKIAASDDEPPRREVKLMAHWEGLQKSASSFQRRGRRGPAIWLRKFRSAMLLTAAAVGGFALVWYLLSSPWPLDLTLKHLAAFPNCDATEMVGLAPAIRGQPGYWSHNDADDDGVACKARK